LRQLGLADSQINSLPTSFGPTNSLVEVLAPMTGTVVKRLVYAGQYVREGDPLFELADFNTMWLKFDAYEQDLAWIHSGQSVEISSPAIPGRVFKGSIAFIDPNLDPASRSAKVRVELPNPPASPQSAQRQFLHRTYAEARVVVEIPGVLIVPRTAVLNPDGQPIVFIDRGDGAYVRTPLVLGRAGDTSWEVFEGVEEGDAVVTHGNLLLDSQAQLAFSAGSEASPRPTAAAPSPGSTPAPGSPGTTSPLLELLQSIDALRTALAADDLAAYNARRLQLLASLEAFSKTADHAVWHEALSKLEGPSKLPEAPDLIQARTSFHAFSAVFLESVLPLKAKETAVAALKIYECPMTDTAFPGAPKKARWFQMRAPLQNPWFGKSMLTCGKEVRP
jgi:Cu(I)/Ag(I) efflux system membrane fusion protein